MYLFAGTRKGHLNCKQELIRVYMYMLMASRSMFTQDPNLSLIPNEFVMH